MKLYIILISSLLVSPVYAQFNDVPESKKEIADKVEKTVTKTDDSKIGVWKVSSSLGELVFKVSGTDIVISGAENKTIASLKSLDTHLKKKLASNPDKIDVKANGYLYTKYEEDKDGTYEVTEKFKSIEHLFNHLYWDIYSWLNPQQ